jgi:ribosomal protein S18 acetylase RimI-like enzyme
MWPTSTWRCSAVFVQIVLEAETDNLPATALYSSLGFVKTKALYRFYVRPARQSDSSQGQAVLGSLSDTAPVAADATAEHSMSVVRRA